MSLRTKLTGGLGFLFLIIFALAIYSSFEIQGLSKSADRILRDNYDSLVYCKNMLLALDDMRTTTGDRVIGPRMAQASPYDSQLFESGRSSFEKNFSAENGNITELHEKEYVEELDKNYAFFLALCLKTERDGGSPASYSRDFLPAYLSARQTVVKINDLNMEAIERKSMSTKLESGKMITSIAAFGAGCILLALFYFWYFPFYVSNTMSFLAGKMKELMARAELNIETRSKDEAFVLLQSINLLESRLFPNGKVS